MSTFPPLGAGAFVAAAEAVAGLGAAVSAGLQPARQSPDSAHPIVSEDRLPAEMLKLRNIVEFLPSADGAKIDVDRRFCVESSQ